MFIYFLFCEQFECFKITSHCANFGQNVGSGITQCAKNSRAHPYLEENANKQTIKCQLAICCAWNCSRLALAKTIAKMLAGGNGDPNPNASWLDSRGLWLAYVLGITIFHIVLLAIPFVQIPYAWTITNIAHNLVSEFGMEQSAWTG